MADVKKNSAAVSGSSIDDKFKNLEAVKAVAKQLDGKSKEDQSSILKMCGDILDCHQKQTRGPRKSKSAPPAPAAV